MQSGWITTGISSEWSKSENFDLWWDLNPRPLDYSSDATELLWSYLLTPSGSMSRSILVVCKVWPSTFSLSYYNCSDVNIGRNHYLNPWNIGCTSLHTRSIFNTLPSDTHQDGLRSWWVSDGKLLKKSNVSNMFSEGTWPSDADMLQRWYELRFLH